MYQSAACTDLQDGENAPEKERGEARSSVSIAQAVLWHLCTEDKSKVKCRSKCSRSASLGGRVALKTLLTIQIDTESVRDCCTVSGKT